MIETGTKFAGYRVERLLGSGGMGTVYLATQESLNRPVALKLLNPALTADETFRARFRREGEVQAALDHPHIVPVYDTGETDDGLYLAMRYVRGSTLKDLIDAGDLDPARTLRLLAPVASALDAAHAAGLIHRDVKPQNILVDQTDWPYLADFGLTRGGAGGPTRTGQLVGTFAYVAPEQIKGQRASARSDQYALAAVLFECLAGEVPHNHESDAALLYAKVHEEPPRLSQRAAGVPSAFDDVLARGMALDPADRYPEAKALLAAASEAFERADEPQAAPAPPVVNTPPAPTPPPAPAPTEKRASQDTVLVDLDAATPPAPSTPRRVAQVAKPRVRRTPRPESAPKPPRATRKPLPVPTTRTIAIGAAAAAVVGVLAGALLGGGDPPAPKTATVGDLGTITLADGMRSARGPAGLGLSSLQVYAQGTGPARRMLAVGTGRPAGPELLPQGALARAAGKAGTPTVVRIGDDGRALRFAALKVSGLTGVTQVVTLPAGARVLVAACAAQRASDAACSQALASLVPRAGTRTKAVAASAGYETGVRTMLTQYERSRKNATALLATAGRAATQARAAGRLRDSAAALATAARGLTPPPGAVAGHAALTRAAADLRSAAGRLATAASAARPKSYASAASAVRRADRALRNAARSMRDVYRER